MEILNIPSKESISLLNITKAQAVAIRELLLVAQHGLRFTAGWHGRKPVIDTISALRPTTEYSFKYDVSCLALETAPGDAAYFQKVLKAFGNRVADAARKPLRFERGVGGGKVHLIPAFHHLTACGSLRVNATTEDDVNCCLCILAALTPATGKNRGQFRPFGHVYLRDAEIRLLRDYAYERATNSIQP